MISKAILSEVLSQYAPEPIVPRFLRHSDNITYCLESPENEPKYLLRFHVPRNERPMDRWRDLQVIESEGIWLAALARDTDVEAPHPVLTLAGEFATMAELDDGVQAPCTVLEWVQGETLDRAVPRTPEMAYSLGQMLAKLHAHSEAWETPAEFDRPECSAEGVQTSLSQIQRLLDKGVISSDDFLKIQQAALFAGGLYARHQTDRVHWGLLHGDLNEINYVVHEDKPRPIDFGFCCFGSYLYDICLCLLHIQIPERPEFFRGYESIRSLADVSQSDLESYYVLSIIINIGYHAQNPAEHEFLAGEVARVAQKHCARLLRNQPFLLES